MINVSCLLHVKMYIVVFGVKNIKSKCTAFVNMSQSKSKFGVKTRFVLFFSSLTAHNLLHVLHRECAAVVLDRDDLTVTEQPHQLSIVAES